MKALMYHYVRPAPEALPHFPYLHIEDFRRQLDWLGSTYGFVDRAAFLRALDGGPVPDGVVLTFDDGLVDHVRHVVPELVARGLWALFYISIAPYAERKLLDVHRIHLLIGQFGGKRVSDLLAEIISKDMLVPERVASFRDSTYVRQHNDECTAYAKRCLNYFIADQHRSSVIDRLMERLVGDTADLVDAYYVSPRDLSTLAAAGMIVGSHGVTHRLMSTLPEAEQTREIGESFAALDRLAGPQVCRTFCYPYGGSHSFTGFTEELLRQSGCRFSFSVEARDISAADLIGRPQALPRYDCNAFPFGRASIGTQRPGTAL